MSELPTTVCPHGGCDARVIEVRLGSKLECIFVDAAPVTWEDGGRVRISTHQPDAPNGLTARKLVNAKHAFGLKAVYRLHAETCTAARKRTRQRATSS